MGFRIQNNIAAMNAQRNLNISDTAMSKSLERLSSGYRINSAKDDRRGSRFLRIPGVPPATTWRQKRHGR